MKKLILYIVPLLIGTTTVVAQSGPKFETWAENPKMHDIPNDDLNEPAVIILQDIKMEYSYNGDYLMLYRTTHRIVKVLDEKGVEMFNKVEIPASGRTKLESIKARTILRNGKVTEVDPDNIKKIRNENGGTSYLFALEGVEPDAEIEYVETDMSRVSFFGSLPFQYSVPVLNTYFEMSYPSRFTFTFKGFNGFPNATESKAGNRKHIKIYEPEIPALRNEPYSYYNLYRQRGEYKIENVASFHAGGEGYNSEYSFNEEMEELYNDYCSFSDSEQVSINKYLLSIGVNAYENEHDKILKIEDAIKSGIVLYPENDPWNDKIDSIVLKKTASDEAYVRFFAGCFKMAGVKFELGLATDKHNYKINNSFQNLAILGHYIFWFPTFNKCLAPNDIYLRYPMVPTSVVGTKAAFTKTDTIGTILKGLAEVRTIPVLPAHESLVDIDTHLSFSDDMVPLAHTTYSYKGYEAIKYRTALALINNSKDRRKEFIDNVIAIAHTDHDIVNSSIYGQELDNYHTNKPIAINATVKFPLLMDKLDAQTYSFQVGMLAGTPEQLYNEVERKMPVDFEYPVVEKHTITVVLPEGCKLENPEILKTNTEYDDDNTGKVYCAFKTDYKLEGQKLTITTNEEFYKTHYAPIDYTYFRNVVNAAADFNKKALIITKGKVKHSKSIKAKKGNAIAKK